MSRSRHQKQKDAFYAQALDMNMRVYMFYWQTLRELAVNRFKWHNLPAGCDERYLEMTLHDQGEAVIFKPWFSSKFMNTHFVSIGTPNIYDNPTHIVSDGNGGWRYALGRDRGVIVFNNRTRTPTFNGLDLYAQRLADIDRTIDVNLKNLKQPVLWLCPEEKIATVRNMLAQYDANNPFILGYDGVMEGVTVTPVPIKVDYLVDKLLLAKARIMNEVYTYLGIDNANQDKRERLVADEVAANDGQVEMSRICCLNARREACAELNERYGLEVSVTWANDAESHVHDMKTDPYAQNEHTDALMMRYLLEGGMR